MHKYKNKTLTVFCSLLLFLSFLSAIPKSLEALSLTDLSNTLTDPRPNKTSDQTIRLTTQTLIPPSGKIILSFENNQFTIPANTNSFDFDFLINGVEKSLSSTPGTGAGSPIGVSVVSGTSGSITFTLNDTDSISAASTLTIKSGTIASFEGGGLRQITNPAQNGSYKYFLTTKNSTDIILDSKTGAVSINPIVGINSDYNPKVATPQITPVSQGFNDSVSITITTVTPLANIYYTLDGSNPTSASTLYSGAITITNNATVKAIAIKAGLANSDIAIELYTKNQTTVVSGGGGGGGGNNTLYYNYSTPVNTTDNQGKTLAQTEATRIVHNCGNGVILTLDLPKSYWSEPVNFEITCLNRATVDPSHPITFPGDIAADTIFRIKMTDSKGPVNTLLLPGTIQLTYTSGQLLPYVPSEIFGYFNTLTPSTWKNIVGTSYQADKFTLSGLWNSSGFYTTAGTKADIDCSSRKADLNCDQRVNLVDLSILLFNWETVKNNPNSDINKDATVDLVDFSILLYYWTN